jgi:hypothetical protein
MEDREKRSFDLRWKIGRSFDLRWKIGRSFDLRWKIGRNARYDIPRIFE